MKGVPLTGTERVIKDSLVNKSRQYIDVGYVVVN